jgi:squalene/oxidosqualene cyclase-like protein
MGGLLPQGPLADRARPVLTQAGQYLLTLQQRGGEWEGEVVWCTMILSQYVIVRRLTGRTILEEDVERIVRHYALTRTADGGWPLHPEGPPQVFTTTLAYVALRLIGVAADDEIMEGARAWLRRQPGGVCSIPTWGKFWLSLLDLYGEDGVAAFPPELFLLPGSTPGHPDQWYCHTRYIYLGMSYLSALGFKSSLGALRDPLRRELYAEPYDTIEFSRHLNEVSPSDLYATPAVPLRLARRLAPSVMRLLPDGLRRRALTHCFARILYEQRATAYQALSPVNGLLNCLAIHATDPAHPDLEPSLIGIETWRWTDAMRGARYAGARSHVWDTAFAARALLDVLTVAIASRPAFAPIADDFSSVPELSDVLEGLRQAHAYLKASQLCDELPQDGAHDRDPISGGWCFSDGAHRWPVSDCTAETLTAVLAMERSSDVVPPAARLPRERVQQALAFILARQNADGGFSTYERQRAGTWLERLNPSEMFRDCMTERSYVECTASAIEAIAAVRAVYADMMADETAAALHRAITFLRGRQRRDGTFPSAWGINLTYAIFHVAKAMAAAGVSGTDPLLARAADWLRSTQRIDGGWGEHFSGCLERRYVEHSRSQAVMTSWALLALTEIDPTDTAIPAGAAWLAGRQQPDGSWPREAVNGVFFGTAMLDYSLYVAYFPTWALARCALRPWK